MLSDEMKEKVEFIKSYLMSYSELKVSDVQLCTDDGELFITFDDHPFNKIEILREPFRNACVLFDRRKKLNKEKTTKIKTKRNKPNYTFIEYILLLLKEAKMESQQSEINKEQLLER